MELLLGGTLTNQLLTPIINLQERVLRIITFANHNDHSNPLFKALAIINSRISSSYIMQYLYMISILALCHQPSPIILQLSINGTSTIQDLLLGLPILSLQYEQIMVNSVLNFKVQKFGTH